MVVPNVVICLGYDKQRNAQEASDALLKPNRGPSPLSFQDSFHSARYVGLHELRPDEAEALAFILPLSSDYPGIQHWYLHKVVPGLRTGTRNLLRVEKNGELIGVGIAKREENERKICTVRVAPHHFGRGEGIRIFDRLLHWLDDDRPHLTVSDEKFPAFERIFDWYGFHATSAVPGLYVPSKVEVGFNEKRLMASCLEDKALVKSGEHQLVD